MSRSSEEFAHYFPFATAVRKQERSIVSQGGVSSHSPSVLAAHASAGPSATSYRENDGPSTGTLGVALATAQESATHEDNDGTQADLANEIGSATSISTTSSVFSSNHRVAKMAQSNGLHKSTSLTPLTNIDSSPRANGMHSPSKGVLSQNHYSAGASPRSPSGNSSAKSSLSTRLDPTGATQPSKLKVRPGKGEVKGYKIVYDPGLDKTGKSKEKKNREAQYEAFGQEVG